jgi:predicted membrane protein
MKKYLQPHYLAYLYGVLSVITYPIVFHLAYRNAPGQGDCSDPAWGNKSFDTVNAIVEKANHSIYSFSIAMLAIGLFLGVWLFVWRRQHKHAALILPTIIIGIILLGFIITAWVMGSPACEPTP